MTGLTYGTSKLRMGSVSHRSNPRYFLSLGLLLSAPSATCSSSPSRRPLRGSLGAAGDRCLKILEKRPPRPWNKDGRNEDSWIRAEALFGERVKATPVAFVFKRGASYEVRAEDNVYPSVDGSNRTLSDSGAATLWKLGTKGAPSEGDSFVLPFSRSVTRVAP
jgi:hypothetical protein